MKFFRMFVAITFVLILVACGVDESGNERSEKSSQTEEISHLDDEIETVFVHGNYVVYENEKDLFEDADLVVLASPKEDFLSREHVARYSEPEGDAPETLADFFTRTSITVKKVLKSPEGLDIQDNSEFDIIEPVSIIESEGVNKKFTIANYVELEEDHSYIIYLKDNTFGEYGVINMNNGRFNLGVEEQFESLAVQDQQDVKDDHEEMKKQVFERFEKEIADYDL